MFHRALKLARGNYLTADDYSPLRRKPARREAESQPARLDDPTSLGVDYIVRACELRRQRKIGVVLVEAGQYWIGCEADPWGTKEPISCEALRALIDEIDVKENVA
ncbi:MAG TPA: hypothetical protein VHC90_11410 [Bryobacteraceae bacterium]|nr:hypothetical protein [Bryobacteraceae bacterium]